MTALTSTEQSTGIYADRLPFVLKSFVRIAWTSTDAERVWSPKFSRVRAAVIRCEWMSVRLKLRRCALFHLCEQDIERHSREWVAHGLNWKFLRDAALRTGAWWLNVNLRRGIPSRPIVLGNNLDISDFERAWDDQDHESIGRLLGYPQCCRSFFEDVAGTQGCVDTLWAMSNSKELTDARELYRSADGPAFSNILLQSLGVRAVPHAPCSFDCQGTALLAHDFGVVARKIGVQREYEWLTSILSWPAQWSGLHGIAEVQTPIVKVCTPTDATGSKHILRWHGRIIPEEGAKGIVFPFKVPTLPRTADALVWPTKGTNHIANNDSY